jgi:hypothetical protein
MPCWQVQTVSVEFQVKHLDLLAKAAASLGYDYSRVGNLITLTAPRDTININLSASTATASNQQAVNKLKQAYSLEALKVASKLGGWQLQLKTGLKGSLVRSVV